MKVIILLIAVNSVLCIRDDVLELIKDAGYKGEAYQVETEDGYLLTAHRILPNNKLQVGSKHPVFLMHGLIATAADYLVTGPKIALAYYLADNGYDVWLGNARGSKHSMNHKTLSIDSGEFWNFSWHEIGFYDLPAMIDFMLMMTQTSKAFYVGHSQGATSFVVFLSSRPEYNQKIIRSHLLAPATFMKHLPHPFVRAVAGDIRNGFFGDYKYLNFAPIWETSDKFSQVFCDIKSATLPLCRSTIFAVVGRNRHGVEIDEVSLLFKC